MLGFFISALVGGMVIGIILTPILLPILMIANSKKLKEMDKKIEDFENKHFSSAEEKEKAKQLLKKDLIKIKAGIVGDVKATEEAGDKISIL